MDENYMGFAARTIPDDQGNFMHVEVLKVTVDGKFIWHTHADELIKNCEDLALKHVLQALKEKNHE
jgi:hypothetical protein